MASATTHPSLTRLYEAAKSLKQPIVGKSAVAAWLNESPQTVNNWEKRGVSRRGAMAAQEKSGYSATWIQNGTGAKIVGKPPIEKGAVFNALSTEEKELIEHWRHLLGKDRRAKLEEIGRLAKERKAEREELLADAGLSSIAQRAASASSNARTSAEPSRQKALDLDEPARSRARAE